MFAKKFYKLGLLFIVLVVIFPALHQTVRSEGGGLLYLPFVSRSSTCTVPSAGLPTIQSAIDSSCDFINLTAALYNENLTIESRAVKISGQGPAATRISGGALDSVINVDEDSYLTLENLTVADGRAERGGGILNQGYLKLSNVTVRDNQTTFYAGGGIYSSGDLFIDNSLIVNNIAATNISAGFGGGIAVSRLIEVQIINTVIKNNDAYAGGGLSVEGFEYQSIVPVVTILNSEISDNQAGFGGGLITSSYTDVSLINTVVKNNSSGASGGGIMNGGDMQIITSQILNNSAATNQGGFGGGGIYNSGGVYSSTDLGNLLIDRSVIRNNYSGDTGGGVYSGGQMASLIIKSSLIADNVAATYSGGGLNSETESYTLIENSTFYNNTAEEFGGGIAGYNLRLINVTVTQNNVYKNGMPGEGGGIAVFNSLEIVNSIVAGNPTGGECHFEFPASGISLGHNIAGDGSCQMYLSSDMINTEPLLGPLQNNGGPTMTSALLSNSPAINTADNVACPPTDQRGVPRPQGPACDIGAYEYNG